MNDIIHEYGDKLHNGAKTNPDVRVQQLFDGYVTRMHRWLFLKDIYVN